LIFVSARNARVVRFALTPRGALRDAKLHTSVADASAERLTAALSLGARDQIWACIGWT